MAALVHLKTGSRESLFALLLLQLTCCFSYSGDLLILIAFPVCLWLLERVQGRRVSSAYLLKTIVGVILFIVLVLFETEKGAGREGRVWDPNIYRALAGYSAELKWLFASIPPVFRDAHLSFLLWGLLPAAFAYLVVRKISSSQIDSSNDDLMSWKRYIGFAVMFLVLAICAYSPYALTTTRFGHERQMLAAGLFLFILLLLPLFLWFNAGRKRILAANLLVATLALGTVIVGLEIRQWYVGVYRIKETLLSTIATLVPQPPYQSVIVIRPTTWQQARHQRQVLFGFYNRSQLFTSALQFMYGDNGLTAGFADMTRTQPLSFGSSGVTVTTTDGTIQAPYGRLILINYSADGIGQLVTLDELKQEIPKGVDVSFYNPGAGTKLPSKNAVTCSLLENNFRPSYCH